MKFGRLKINQEFFMIY